MAYRGLVEVGGRTIRSDVMAGDSAVRAWIGSIIPRGSLARSLNTYNIFSGPLVASTYRKFITGRWYIEEVCGDPTRAGNPCALSPTHSGHHRKA